MVSLSSSGPGDHDVTSSLGEQQDHEDEGQEEQRFWLQGGKWRWLKDVQHCS